jgi:hypothetical protein
LRTDRNFFFYLGLVCAWKLHHHHHHHRHYNLLLLRLLLLLYLLLCIRSFGLFRHRRVAIVSWGVHNLFFLEVCS